VPVLTNPRHERYAQELAKGKTADDAYSSAGFKPNRGNASTLKTNQSILARVAELQERAAIRTEITIERITEMLMEDRAFARENGQAAPAVAATEKLGKLHGLFVDRTINENVNTNYVVSGEPVEDIEGWAAEHSPSN
jgi:hypothetical protein